MKARRATMVALIALLLSVTSACQPEPGVEQPVETGRISGRHMSTVPLGIECALLDSSDALRMAEALGAFHRAVEVKVDVIRLPFHNAQ
ncbi:MAG: hypothetical protein FJ026_03090 [Chloroflexi bacterium]|nr:hypothetical protein [Chloroflexota bacterium]